MCVLCSHCGFVVWLLLSSPLWTSALFGIIQLLASCSCWSLSAHLAGFNPVEWSFRTVSVTVAHPNGADHPVCQREQGQLTLLVRTSLTVWAWCFWILGQWRQCFGLVFLCRTGLPNGHQLIWEAMKGSRSFYVWWVLARWVLWVVDHDTFSWL